MSNKYLLDPAETMFLIIDVQVNLATAMEKEVISIVASNINIIVKASKELNIPILCTEQYPKGLGPTLNSIVKNIGNSFKPVEKIGFSACSEPAFQNLFTNINKKYVMLAGIESHVCVLQTTLDLLEQGYIVHIMSDAVCSRYKSDWKNAMEFLRGAGAVISTTEIAIFQLLQKAGTPAFKAISPMFKKRNDHSPV